MLTQETGESGRKGERKATFWEKKERKRKRCGKKIDSEKL